MASSGSGTGTGAPGGSSGTGLGITQPLPRTLLPLARYAEIMQIKLPHFQQLNGALAPVTDGCDKLWDQQARADLAWTMVQAEELIANELGFFPAPKFITDEEISFGLTKVRSDWRFAEVRTEHGLIEGFGTEKLTLLEADAFVTYENLDSNPFGRTEAASIGSALYSTLTACGDACEVAVFFRVEDGAEDDAHPSWEIRPLKIDIDGSTMTIMGEASLFVRPELWALTEADCAGSDDITKWKWDFNTNNLVGRVDIYCRTIDTRTPVTLQWDGACACSSTICEHETQTACAHRTNKRQGSFAPRPATWNGSANIEATPTYGFPPESILVNYRSGMPLNSDCSMNHLLERAIVKLTNVLLPRPPCGFCDAAQVRWEQDRKPIDPITTEIANLPWGFTQGAFDAWRTVKRLAMGRGGKLGHG